MTMYSPAWAQRVAERMANAQGQPPDWRGSGPARRGGEPDGSNRRARLASPIWNFTDQTWAAGGQAMVRRVLKRPRSYCR